MQRTFKYRLYPNRKQREILGAQLAMCRELYNAALQERIESYKVTGKGVTWLQQQSQLPAIHEHVVNQRKDFQHKLSHSLVQTYRVIAVEALNIKGLADGMLAKSVHDAGWAGFIQMLAYKAESAGRKLIAVNPRGTSQTCVCGASVPKRLSDREHVCTACGLIANRDHVSAQIILQRARTVPSCANESEVTLCVA